MNERRNGSIESNAQSANPSGQRARRLLLALPMLLLPLLLGGARPWFWASTAAVFLTGTALLLWTDQEAPLYGTLPRKTAIVMLIFLLYPLIQCIPLPESWLAILSPQRLIWLQKAEAATRLSSWWPSISYVPVLTIFNLFWWTFLLLFAWLFRRVLWEDSSVDWLLFIVVCLAGFEAVYGLLQTLIPSLGVLWESTGSGKASGTFVNPNHYAAFLGMVWPMLLVQLKIFRRKAALARSENGEKRRITYGELLLTSIVGLVFLALVFSQSRAGAVGALVALTVFLILGDFKKKTMMVFLGGCWMIIFAYGGTVGLDEVLAPFDRLSPGESGRFKIFEDTWSIIQDHLWTGAGLGSYPTVISCYESHLSDTRLLTHAHNDYLELAAELGLPAALTIVVLAWRRVYLSAKDAWRWNCGLSGDKDAPPREGDKKERRNMIRAAAVAGGCAFLLESLMEFNWQVPANQLYFVMLLVLMRIRV